MIARDVLGVLKLEEGRRWIDAAIEFQREDALSVLEGREPYNFLTRSSRVEQDHGLERGRAVGVAGRGGAAAVLLVGRGQ
jgi:hypothetical protein